MEEKLWKLEIEAWQAAQMNAHKVFIYLIIVKDKDNKYIELEKVA